MRIIVSDTSCLIDLRKADLLAALLALGYHVQVALPLVTDELSTFTAEDWQRLQDLGLEVVDLDGAQVARSFELRRNHRRLSAYDAMSLALAEVAEETILLTCDQALRVAAQVLAVEVHGVLWVFDLLEQQGLLPVEELRRALTLLHHDPLVFLPNDEVLARLERFGRGVLP